jgi:hypothetical protein
MEPILKAHVIWWGTATNIPCSNKYPTSRMTGIIYGPNMGLGMSNQHCNAEVYL